MKLKKLDVRMIINILIVFFYLFQPAIFKISTVLILDCVILVFILAKVISRGKLIIHRNRKIKNILLSFVPFIIYYILSQLCRTIYIQTMSEIFVSNIVRLLFIMLRVIIAVAYFYYLRVDLNYSSYSINKLFFGAGYLQLLCVILAITFPQIRLYFNNMTLKNTDSKYIYIALTQYSYRSYGFAGNLFDGLGYIMALIICIVFSYGMFKNRITYIISSFALLFIVLYNTRSGLLLGITAIIMSILPYIKIDYFKRILKIIVIITVVVLIASIVMNSLPKETRQWVINGYNSITLLFKGEKAGTFAKILDQNFIWPEDVLFGAGGSAEQIIDFGIESGYVGCIWEYGIIGTILLFWGYLNLFITCYRSSNEKLNKSIAIGFITVFFLYMFKLLPVTNTGANFIIFGYVATMLFDDSVHNKKRLES